VSPEQDDDLLKTNIEAIYLAWNSDPGHVGASMNYVPSLNREYLMVSQLYSALYVYTVVHVRSKIKWLTVSMCDRRARPNGETAEWEPDEWATLRIHKYRSSDRMALTQQEIGDNVPAPFFAPERERLLRFLGGLASGAQRVLVPSLWTVVFEFLRGEFVNRHCPSVSPPIVPSGSPSDNPSPLGSDAHGVPMTDANFDSED
jgi:hypothetical protein